MIVPLQILNLAKHKGTHQNLASFKQLIHIFVAEPVCRFQDIKIPLKPYRNLTEAKSGWRSVV
jgi:hypothetical protein